MLTNITIQNFGLIDRLSIEFRDRLNILTGETGAGKSILIDALRFALGERMAASHVRNPDLPCVVEAVFELPKKTVQGHPSFSEHLADGGPELIINRSYTPDGRSKVKINGFSVTMAQLKELGDHLIDFHGPHDHQLLFSSDSHMDILDRISDLDKLRAPYTEKYREYSGLLRRQHEIKDMAQSRDRELETLAYQIKELGRVPLDETKYEELMREQGRLNNAEKLHECINSLIDILGDPETGISEAISRAFGPMRTLNSVDESAAGFAGQLDQLQENGEELLSALNGYRDGLSFDQETANDINARCDIYYDIKRKYGPGLEDARKFYERAKGKHDLMIDLEHSDADIARRIKAIEDDLNSQADRLTKERKKTASSLQKTIEKELTELGIKQVRFECRIERTGLNANGQDTVTFYISPNAGEDLKPLADIASSGEAARVMLALKKALIKVDPIPVLIFDEIDAQIGGRLGTITGRKLKELSDGRQVILITHLPQIASFADSHFKVSKRVENNRTITIVDILDRKTRVLELAKMMSGEKESSISVKHAEDLLAQAKK